jgi:hypothetical protein
MRSTWGMKLGRKLAFLYGERPTKSGSQEHMTGAKKPEPNVSVSPDEHMRPERFGP